VAVLPTAFGIFCLARFVAFAAGLKTSESKLSDVILVALSFELYLFSLSLLAGRVVTLIARDHSAFAGVLDYAVLAFILLAFAWPTLLMIAALKVFSSPHRFWRLNLSSVAASIFTPAIACGVFLLQYGHAELEPPPDYMCSDSDE
jgi:hypothetical protein